MKNLKLLIIAAAVVLLVSCQGTVNPEISGNGNEKINESEVFDINKLTIKGNNKSGNNLKKIKTLSVGNSHYIIIYLPDEAVYSIKYNNEELYSNKWTTPDWDAYHKKYFQGTLDCSDIETLRNMGITYEFEVSGNKIYVTGIEPIPLYSFKDYFCEQENGHFLTLSDGKIKRYYELDLSDNIINYKYNSAAKRDVIKKTDITNVYAKVDNNNNNFTQFERLSSEKFGYNVFYYDEDTIIENCLSAISSPANLHTYNGYKFNELHNRYNLYYSGKFKNGLKLKYKNDILYFDFELDSIDLYDQYEDTMVTKVLEWFTLWDEDIENTNSYPEIDVMLDSDFADIGLSPFENKVVRLFDLGFVR